MTFSITKGPLTRGETSEESVPIPHNMEPMLRKLGMPTFLVQGVVTLREDYTVCSEGDVLTPEQCQLLKCFHVVSAKFKVAVIASWIDGIFQVL